VTNYITTVNNLFSTSDDWIYYAHRDNCLSEQCIHSKRSSPSMHFNRNVQIHALSCEKSTSIHTAEPHAKITSTHLTASVNWVNWQNTCNHIHQVAAHK